MKRMEPLAEENKKLREALNLSEQNIRRAQRERDLAESNSLDLEHQKGVLSERLSAASEQLQKKSERLAIISEELKNMSEQLGNKNKELKNKSEQLDRKCQQFEDVSKQKSGMPYYIMYFAVICQSTVMITVVLAEQDAELSQPRQTIEQIQQEKAKESERAAKLAEELKGRYPLMGSNVVVLFWSNEPF